MSDQPLSSNQPCIADRLRALADRARIPLADSQVLIDAAHHIEHIEDLLGAAYQLAGLVGAPVRFLDAFSRHEGSIETLLPVSLDECEPEWVAAMHEKYKPVEPSPAPLDHCPHQTPPRNGWCLQCVHKLMQRSAQPPSAWRSIKHDPPPRDTQVLLYSPPENLSSDPHQPADMRVDVPQNFTWATHWQPLPGAPTTKVATPNPRWCSTHGPHDVGACPECPQVETSDAKRWEAHIEMERQAHEEKK